MTTRHTARSWLLRTVAGALIPLALAAPAHARVAGPGGARVDTFGSMDLLLPTSSPSGGSAVTLTAAKNEFESFQVAVSASAGTLPGVTMSTTPLTGPGGTIPADNVRFYREDYYKLTTMSDGELASQFPRSADGTCQGDCRIPDALIPERDVLTNEDRAAFPMTVPASENRVAWVDVLVPQGATAGAYTGSVQVRSSAGVVATIPLTVNVLNVAMPSTPTFKSQFYVNAGDVGNSWSTYQQLAELGLSDRVDLVPSGFSPAQGAAGLTALLNGTDPKVMLPGAHLTQLPLNQWSNFTAWKTYLDQQGKTDLARYWCDEVTTSVCANGSQQPGATSYNDAVRSWPSLRLQQIPMYQKPVTDADLLDPRTTAATPVVTGLDQNLAWYQQWRAAKPGRELWAYTGCMQGGCTAPYLDNRLYNGTPGLGIDQPTSQARAMGWQGFRAGLDGEHYWQSAYFFSTAWNACSGVQPSNCQYRKGDEAGMNGDGNLFYPWNQAKVGGTTPIPVESLRLKRFRDGREDNELMQLLAAKGRASDARSIASSLFPSFTDNTKTPAQVASARTSLENAVRSAYPVTTQPARTPIAQDLDCDGDADMLAVASDGRLLIWSRQNGDWDPNAPIVIGTGWAGKYTQLLLPGDLTGDGRPDLLGRKQDGSLDLWKGNCASGFTAAGSVAGMTFQDPTTPGDFDGDGFADLLDRHSDGTLWLASGNGAGGFTNLRQMGAGWTGFTIVAAGDADRDGHADLFGRRSDGHVFLYRGNGHGGWVTGNGEDSGLLLPASTNPRLLGPGDMNGDGSVDMVVMTSSGDLVMYAGNGTGGWSGTGVRIGSGWNTAVVQFGD